MAGRKLDPDKREAIAQAVRDGAGIVSASAIAKEHGCSRTSVTNIAREIGLGEAFDRSKTANATAAKQQDNRARRAAIIAAYLDDAARIRERLWQHGTVVTPMGEVVTLEQPPARDVKDFVSAGTSLVKLSLEVEKHDQGDSGAEAARSVLELAAAGMRQVYDAIQVEEKAAPVGDPVPADDADG